MLRAALLAASAAVAALVASGLASSAAPSAAGDVRALAEAYQRSHPSPYASTPRARFRAETNALAARAPKLSRPQLVVGLMRLLALAGARNGHTAIYPYDAAPAAAARLSRAALRVPDRAARRRRAGP